MKHMIRSTVIALGVLSLGQNCAQPKGFDEDPPAKAEQASTSPTATPSPTPEPKTFSYSYPVTLVGWVAHNTAFKVPLSNTAVGFQGCPAIPLDGTKSGYYEHFCYEPSGANGLYLSNRTDTGAAIGKIKNYILSRVANLAAIKDLSTIVNYQNNVDIVCHQEAAFVYGLAQLALPNIVTPEFLSRFSFKLTNVDDGSIFIANNAMVGDTNIYEFKTLGKTVDQFPLHKGKSGTMNALNSGINDLGFVLADNCKNATIATVLTGAAVMYETTAMVPKVPHVIQGYVYSESQGAAVPGASVEVVGGTFYRQMVVDDKGFFEFEGIPPGNYDLRVFAQGTLKSQSSLTLGALLGSPWLTRIAIALP